MNKSALIATAVTGVLTLALGVNTFSAVSALDDVEAKQAAASSEMAKLDRSVAEKQATRDTEQKQVIKDVTGLDIGLVDADRDVASEFFMPAFNWADAKGYNAARTQFAERLGDGNSFTKTYMPEDLTIDTDDGKLSYIDFKEVRSEWDGMVVTPLTAEGNRIRYVGVVRHYMYAGDGDIQNKDALKPSEAVVTFTVSGEASERNVSEVEAWAGFESAATEN